MQIEGANDGSNVIYQWRTRDKPTTADATKVLFCIRIWIPGRRRGVPGGLGRSKLDQGQGLVAWDITMVVAALTGRWTQPQLTMVNQLRFVVHIQSWSEAGTTSREIWGCQSLVDERRQRLVPNAAELMYWSVDDWIPSCCKHKLSSRLVVVGFLLCVLYKSISQQVQLTKTSKPPGFWSYWLPPNFDAWEIFRWITHSDPVGDHPPSLITINGGSD